jgi:serine/threonine protein kinase
VLASTDLLDAIRRLDLLTAEQFERLGREPALVAAEPRVLAAELLARGWLTPFQVNRLLQGRPEELLLGHYLLLERLGEGGMGTVYKARHQRLGRITALKVIKKERLQNDEAVRRFQREVRVAAQLNHVNVVRAFDADEVNGTHLLVMEYVDGTDLAQLVKTHGPMPVERACGYIRQAALGLAHAHERGLIHRDIKPRNVLVTADAQTVKILDMGLARIADSADAEKSATMTREGTVMGTPDYMAPEQAISAHAADIRSDLYSLGCTSYFLLAGKPPFSGGTLMQKLISHREQPPPLLEAIRPDVPGEVARVVYRLLAKDPAERYQSPQELATALANYADLAKGAPLRQTTGPSTAPERVTALPGDTAVPGDSEPAGGAMRSLQQALPRTAPQRRWVLGAAAAVVLIVVVALGFVSWHFFSTGRSPAVAEEEKLKLPRSKGGPLGLVTLDDDWVKGVRAVPAERQVEEVVKLLKKWNHGFDGKVTYKTADGKVTELDFCTNAVIYIAPIRALADLKKLTARGVDEKGRLADLAPLEGMSLIDVDIGENLGINNLASLRHLRLKRLSFGFTTVSDLSPLSAMPLEVLIFNNCSVKDLSPLKGVPLRHLAFGGWDSPIADLTPLKGAPLRFLGCPHSAVSDLTPLADCPLETLQISNTRVADLSPLKKLQLNNLSCDFVYGRDRDILKSIKTLEKINGKPAAEFWQQVDAPTK